MKEQTLILFKLTVNLTKAHDQLGLEELLDIAYKGLSNLLQLMDIFLMLSNSVQVGI